MQKNPERTPLATPTEVAEYIRKPPKTLAEWRYRGLGPRYCVVGRDVRYRWDDVDRWLADQEQEGAPDPRAAAAG
jgi:Helix-turn-helix domain